MYLMLAKSPSSSDILSTSQLYILSRLRTFHKPGTVPSETPFVQVGKFIPAALFGAVRSSGFFT